MMRVAGNAFARADGRPTGRTLVTPAEWHVPRGQTAAGRGGGRRAEMRRALIFGSAPGTRYTRQEAKSTTDKFTLCFGQLPLHCVLPAAVSANGFSRFTVARAAGRRRLGQSGGETSTNCER